MITQHKTSLAETTAENNNKRCLIILAGPIGNCEPLKKRIRRDDFVICVDGGLEHASALGVTPDLLLGDFDSLERAVPEGIETIRYKKEKDETDSMLAIQYALKKGFRNVLILGGLKGRLDHTFANFGALLYLIRKGAAGSIADSDNEVYILLRGEMRFRKTDDSYFSIFPFGEEALGVTEKGFKYSLNDARIDSDYPLGVSNEFSADEASVSVKKGPLLIILSKKGH